MSLAFDWQGAIDKFYPAGSLARGILLAHSHAVAAAALDIARRRQLPLDQADVECAAMVHDIGIIRTNAPGIGCSGSEPYLLHGVLGADMLRGLGAPEELARVAERHTGAGLTAAEIAAANLPMPPGRDYMPRTLLERLVCYADCFFSKGPDLEALGRAKPLERVRASMQRFGPEVLSRFEALREEFGAVNGQ